jgi:peptide/nickel transport system ATP-binding protein
MDLLVNLGQRTGTAIMFITHNLGLVAESCERVLTMYAGQIIEQGGVGDVLRHPLHPYTEGLLKALPHGQKRKTALNAIPGRVPSPRDMPEGCRFQPRCGYDQPVCLEPQGFVKVDQRLVRCCRATELALHGAAA